MDSETRIRLMDAHGAHSAHNINNADSARRAVLTHGLRWSLGLGAAVWLRPAQADAPELAAAIRAFANGAPVQTGRVKLEVSTLIDNGNTVPITVRADSPMTPADHVQRLAVFNERNPQREVIACRLGPRSGRAMVSTRIRLATSQQLVALAQMSDGTVWSHTVDVIVTLAACIE